MKLDIDLGERQVALSADKAVYSKDAIVIAAHVFDSRAEVYLAEEDDAWEVTLKAKRRDVREPELRALGGEFFNELLNQEYRFVVSGFNRKVADLIVTQTLFSARGGETPPAAPAGEQTPEFLAEVASLMETARDEVARTMPKKIAPQGNPLPPAEESVG